MVSFPGVNARQPSHGRAPDEARRARTVVCDDLGGEVNIHTPHWHGNVVSIEGHRTDIFSLLPAQFVTADMVPDNIGMWMFHCHVDEHMEAGMTAMP